MGAQEKVKILTAWVELCKGRADDLTSTLF